MATPCFVWGKHRTSSCTRTGRRPAAPWGTGPYRLEQWDKGAGASPVQIRGVGRAAQVRIDKAEFRFINDPTPRWPLQAGEVDVAVQFRHPQCQPPEVNKHHQADRRIQRQGHAGSGTTTGANLNDGARAVPSATPSTAKPSSARCSTDAARPLAAISRPPMQAMCTWQACTPTIPPGPGLAQEAGARLPLK